jgi:hypothetical protein
MLPTAPMDCENDLARGRIVIGDDVGDQCAQQLLARSHRHARRVPRGRQVFCQPSKVWRYSGGVRLPHSVQSRLTGLHPLQSCFPAFFKLRGNQSIIGIARGVAPLRERGLIAGLLQLQFHDALLFALDLHIPALGLQCSLNGHRLDRAQQFACDGDIDAHRAEGKTSRATQHLIGPLATINWLTRCAPRIADGQSTSATPAHQQPGQQSSTTAPGFGAARFPVGVRREQLLIAFELGPLDIALVVILNHNFPLVKWFAVPVRFANATLDDGRSLLALAVDVSAGVERVLQHRDNAAVPDGRPIEAHQLFAIGRSREVKLVSRHRQQYLACAAELAKASEDQSNRFLQAQIRIKPEADLAVPDVANGHADPQLSPSGFGARGIEHTSAQDPKFKLTDAALHTEQQSIVGPTRIVDTVHIDHPRFDQTTQLKQVVPVATVTGKTGGIKTQHCAHFSGAEPRHQSIEAGSCHRAARRAPQIVVNHFDVDETTAPRFLDQVVLSAFALEVRLYLRLGRLAHIHHGLAFEDRGRK